jgi:hypothetical protein
MATEISLPVTRVVVMEDRAQVERRGEVELEGGPQRLEVHGLGLVANHAYSAPYEDLRLKKK